MTNQANILIELSTQPSSNQATETTTRANSKGKAHHVHDALQQLQITSKQKNGWQITTGLGPKKLKNSEYSSSHKSQDNVHFVMGLGTGQPTLRHFARKGCCECIWILLEQSFEVTGGDQIRKSHQRTQPTVSLKQAAPGRRSYVMQTGIGMETDS